MRSVFILASILDTAQDLTSVLLAALIFSALFLLLKGLEHA